MASHSKGCDQRLGRAIAHHSLREALSTTSYPPSRTCLPFSDTHIAPKRPFHSIALVTSPQIVPSYPTSGCPTTPSRTIFQTSHTSSSSLYIVPGVHSPYTVSDRPFSAALSSCMSRKDIVLLDLPVLRWRRRSLSLEAGGWAERRLRGTW